MRGGKSFLILAVVALAIGGYAYFVESKRDLTPPDTKMAKVFTIESGKIEEIQVKAASGEQTTMKKSGNEWQVTAPQAMDGDSNMAGSLVSSLESLEVQRVVDENPSSVSNYGLEPARISVAFRTAGDATLKRLNIGIKTANGSDLYARVEGQPKVILIGGFLEDSFNKTTFDLRDKSVLKFARDAVDGLQIDAPGSPAVSVAKKGADWRLTAPLSAKADFSASDGVVNQIAQARMRKIVADVPAAGLSAADAKKYGLDKPAVTATLAAGSTRAALVIGGKADDTTVYARDSARPMVFTLDKSVLDGVKKTAGDLRSKELFEFRSFTVLGLTMTSGGQAYEIKKEKVTPAKDAKDQTPTEAWKLVKPSAKDLDQTKVTDLLSNTSNLRAEKFADKAQTSGDEMTVTARFGDEASPKTETVTFRKLGTVVHATKAGEPGAAIVPTADYDKVVAALKDLAGIK